MLRCPAGARRLAPQCFGFGLAPQSFSSTQQRARCLSIPAWFSHAHEDHLEASSTAFVSLSLVPDANFGKRAAAFRRKYMDQKLSTVDFKTLESMRFAWSIEEAKWENIVVPALLKYKELHEDMNVPFSFVVPSSDDWPEKLWGKRLGETVRDVRSYGTFVRDDEERRQWLEDNGFEFDMHKLSWEKAQCALVQFKELHGDMNVPFRFVVPSSDDWPEEMWGEKLGETVNRIRSYGDFVRDDEERRQWLQECGFRFEKTNEESARNSGRWTQAQCALLKYKELHEDMNVPVSFVVPSSDDWPEEMWSKRLGETVNRIRSRGTFVRDDEERRQWLEDNGFEFDMHKLSWEKAQCALVQFKELHGDMNVPFRFVVPSSDDWPEDMWGEKLGRTVDNIRSSGTFVRDDEERRQWLEEQGFVWKMRLSTTERVRAAAAYYGRVRIGAVKRDGSD